MDMRKYFMAKLSAAQYDAEYFKMQVDKIDGKSTDLAEGPANGAVAKQAAAKAAAAKPAVKKAAPKVEEPEEVESDELVVEDEEVSLDPESDESGGISEQDVVKAIQGLAVKLGKPYVAALLKKFKAKAIQDLKEKDYEQVLATIESTLKAKKK